MLKGGEFVIPSKQLPDIFCIDDLSEEQRLIRDTVKKFTVDILANKEIFEKLESKDLDLMRKLMGELAEIGLLGIEVPEEFGGGLDKVSSAVVSEEIGKLGSFGISVGAHKGIGAWPIVFFGTREQKEKYLPKLANGEMVAAYALTEAGAGSDANAARTTAVNTDAGFLSKENARKGYLLNGEKIFVTNGGFADLFTVFAKLDDKLTAFLVERNFSGVKIGKEEHKMGIRGSSTISLVLDNALVPAGNLLGKPGGGFKIAMNVLNLGRFSLGAGCLGAGRLCLEESMRYARERKQFGRPIIEFGLIRQKLAEMTAKIYAMESVVYRTAGLLESAIGQVDAGNNDAILEAISEYAIECSLVKVFCSEALDFITDENVQIHGGSGFCEELPAARHYRDARINRIFEGTNEINRLFAVSELLKRVGKLSLLPAIKQVMADAISSGLPGLLIEPENLNAQLFGCLNNAKKAVLLAGGAISQKFPDPKELLQHQYILGQLCDCLTEIYVLESALAALAKNSGTGGRREYLTRLLFAQFLPVLGEQVKNVLAVCVQGDNLRTSLAMARRFLKTDPENMEFLHDKILES